MIADYDGDVTKLLEDGAEGAVPILATRNLMLFPGIVMPILIGRKPSRQLVEMLKTHEDQLFAVFCQKDEKVEIPGERDLYDYGVYARAIRILDLPGNNGNNVSLIVQGGSGNYTL